MVYSQRSAVAHGLSSRLIEAALLLVEQQRYVVHGGVRLGAWRCSVFATCAVLAA